MFKLEIVKNNLEPNFKTFSIRIPNTYFSNLPKSIKIDNTSFFLKNEFHITIIGRTISKEIYSKIKKNQVNSVLKDIEKKIETDLSNFTVEFEKYYLLKKKYEFENNTRISIVQTITSNLISKVHSFLNVKYKLQLDRGSKPHISLYTIPNTLAVGLNYEGDFKKYKVKEINLEHL